MKKIKILSFLILIFIAFEAKAVDETVYGSSGGDFVKVGAAGAQFLKIGIGARGNAIGAYSALANDLSSIYWNPAGLADIHGICTEFSYTQWFAKFNHSFAAAAFPIGNNFTLAAHFVSLSSDKIEITTLSRADGTGNYYTAQDLSMGVSFSGYLTDQFSFGVTAKYLMNGFADLSASGIAFDVGTHYETGIQGIKLAFSIHNLGSQMQYTGQDLNKTIKIVEAAYASPIDAQFLTSSYNIPLIFRAGISSELYNEGDHKVQGAIDFTTLSDTPEQFSFGGEYTFKDLLDVRAGYRTGHDQFGFSAGVGIHYLSGGFNGSVDYAFCPTTSLGTINRLSVRLGLK